MSGIAGPTKRLEAQSVAEIIGWARDALGLTYREVGEIAGATTRTAQRWGDADNLTVPSGEHRAKIEELRDLKRLLTLSFPDDEAAALAWLHRSVPALQRRRPIDLIRHGEVDAVVGVLAGAYAGAYA